MSGVFSDSQYEVMKGQASEFELEAMYERMIQKTLKLDCDRALAMVDRKLGSSQNKQYLWELKARILWYKKIYDKGVFDALGNIFSSAGAFRFPMTYLVYGTSLHVKEGSDDQLNLYKLGLQEAENKNDQNMINEFRTRIQLREEIELRRLEKLNKKKGKMIIEEKRQEEQESVKDIEKDFQNVDEMIEHNISKQKEKYEVEIFPDCGKQFTLINKLGEKCYMGIHDTGKVQIEKSLVAATKHQVKEFHALHSICAQHHSLLTVEFVVHHPIDNTDESLVCEVVHTLEDFFDKEFQKLRGAQMTETLWWDHICESFRIIFRDVIQGMMFLYLRTDFGCHDLSFNIFVTKSGNGRILPSMIQNTIGRKECVNQITQLKDAMRTVIAFPFNGVIKNLELPLELRRFLDFDHSRCFGPTWFVINCPFFWTVNKKVQFAHELKMLFKLNRNIKWEIETCLKKARVFEFWKDKVPEGVYKKILHYHESTTSKAKAEVEDKDKAKVGDGSEAEVEDKAGDGSACKEVQASDGYHERADICRFFVASYTHVNDYMYLNDRRFKPLRRAEIEAALSTYFLFFYVDMFECLCKRAGELGDEVLKVVSSLGRR